MAPWCNQTPCQGINSVVRLGVVRDERFGMCYEGRPLLCHSRGGEHRPRAPERTAILMAGTAGMVPTGDQSGTPTPTPVGLVRLTGSTIWRARAGALPDIGRFILQGLGSIGGWMPCGWRRR